MLNDASDSFVALMVSEDIHQQDKGENKRKIETNNKRILQT